MTSYILLLLLSLCACCHCYSGNTTFLKLYDYEESIEHRPVVNLIQNITNIYMNDCVPYILYDEFFFNTIPYKFVLERLLQTMPNSFVHSYIDKFEYLESDKSRKFCNHFIVFVLEPETVVGVLDTVLKSKVILVTAMSQWQIKEFLLSKSAKRIYNLLIIADPTLQKEEFISKTASRDINMYTHDLYVDGIGSSSSILLTSWRKNTFARPSVNLFPRKLEKGFHGHQFIVSVAEQPPFVFQKNKGSQRDDGAFIWDGIEVRTLRMMAEIFNITLVIQKADNSNSNDSAEQVMCDVARGKSDIGISGIYITREHYDNVDFSNPHFQDCASFITLTSTAIPKYRAILGPFQFTVWLCVISVYLFGAVPIRYSQRRSIRTIFRNCADVGYTFWVVFGTFSNCFTFKGESAWNSVLNLSSRILVGTYWILTIIITSAYSSSIISFITTATYFKVVDSVAELLEQSFVIGTLDTREWKFWFNDTTDSSTNKLLKNIEILSDIDAGLENVVRKKRYAFLGSKEQLLFFISNNYMPSETGSRKSKYHILDECLVNLLVSFIMKPKSELLIKFNNMLLRLQENGILSKLKADIQWEALHSGGTGTSMMVTANSLLYTTSVDRQLTVDDMQGMFLLLGVGIGMAFASVIEECFSGYNFCQRIKTASRIPSIILTPPLPAYGQKIRTDPSCIKRSSSSITYFSRRLIVAAISKISIRPSSY